MSLWGTTTADGDKPKFLPVDSNASGSTGAREHLIASASGWALAPGLAASGNDNTSAQPEILVCVKNIAEAMGNASIIGIDWTDATVGLVKQPSSHQQSIHSVGSFGCHRYGF
jgi:hypothetical protein